MHITDVPCSDFAGTFCSRFGISVSATHFNCQQEADHLGQLFVFLSGLPVIRPLFAGVFVSKQKNPMPW